MRFKQTEAAALSRETHILRRNVQRIYLEGTYIIEKIDPDRSRTCDLMLRRHPLYPTELLDHGAISCAYIKWIRTI